MSSNSIIHHDQSWLSKADRLLSRIETPLVLISGLAVFGLVLLAVLSVSGRLFFGQPLAGYIDWIEQFMPVISFSGIAYGLRHGIHIRMDMVLNFMRGRAYYLAELISTIFILILTILLLWGAWAHFDRSFDISQPYFSRDSSIDIGLPLWPAKLLVPIAFFTLLLRAILQLIAYSKSLIYNPELPVAIPLAMNIEQQAQAEADQLSGQD